MKFKIYRFFIGMFLSLSGIGMMNALPAQPGLLEASQPDGSTVMIRLEGDAFSHRAYSEDGYLLLPDVDGYYSFADVDENGMPMATAIRAINIGNRSAEQIAAIQGLDKDKIIKAFNLKDSKINRLPMRNPGLAGNSFPSKGNGRSLAILVEFANNEFTVDNPNEYYTRQLNEENFSDNNATGSARDYFIDNSNGLFTPSFDVYGPVKVSQEYAYYGKMNDEKAYEMIIEACEAIDDMVDFSQYDCNGDGEIDNVYVYYAGYGEADGGGVNTIWPHSWDLMYATYEKYYFDNVRLNHYACSNELRKQNSTPDGIGAFLHEFSHVMGLPDLYSTDGGSGFTPGAWSILDQGSYNHKSCTPPHYSSYERYALEWMEPEIISESGEYSLRPLDESNHAFIVPTENENEFFLLENRQFNKWDKYIPWHGMLVWHIDFDQDVWDMNTVNNDPFHQRVDLVEADNNPGTSTVNDSFPGRAGITEFTADTTPAFVSWSNTPTGVNIYDIKESEDGVITFTVVYEDPNAGVKVPASLKDNFRLNGDLLTCKSGGLSIYDISGRKVGMLAGGESAVLPKGFYVVSSQGISKKIVVK